MNGGRCLSDLPPSRSWPLEIRAGVIVLIEDFQAFNLSDSVQANFWRLPVSESPWPIPADANAFGLLLTFASVFRTLSMARLNDISHAVSALLDSAKAVFEIM
jgi:hypothetical protein